MYGKRGKLKIFSQLLTLFTTLVLFAACNMHSDETRNQVKHIWYFLDYVELDITVKNSITHAPIQSAHVSISYNDTTGNVVHSISNPLTGSGSTNSQGRVVIRMRNPYGFAWRSTDSRSSYIRSNKNISVTISQTGFTNVITSRSFTPKHVGTTTFKDDIGWDEYRAFAVDSSTTFYLTPW